MEGRAMSLLDPRLPYIEARLRVRPTAEGGRAGSVFPGYRAGWWVPHRDGQRVYTDGAVYPIDEEELAPGTAGSVRIYPLVRENWSDVGPGTELEMCEGPRVVGVATVAKGLASGTPAPPQRVGEALAGGG